ncbi:MAG: DUF5312 family protein [Treponema sp.]|nr:DUF5312 family protein [Treponema sp.]
MGVENKKNNPSASKGGFFQNLLDSLFKSTSPEAEKKRKLKAIAKNFQKTKYHTFYKTSTFEILPPFAKLFYDIYKLIAPAQTMLHVNENMSLYKSQIINYNLSEKQVELSAHFDEQKIMEMSHQIPLQKLTAQIEEELDIFSQEFTAEKINRTENIYKAFNLFKDFCSFDYYMLLKKFNNKLIENNFSAVPSFEKMNAEYIIDNLKDFITVSYPLTDESIIWDDLFAFIKSIRGSEPLSVSTWKKIVAKIRAIKSSGAFDLMVRHITGNPMYDPDIPIASSMIVEPYIDKLQEEVNGIISKINYAQKESKANSFCEQIFGTSTVQTLKNYTSAANSVFEKKELSYYEYTEPLNYLKAFILEYVKKDIREFYDVVVIRGQWDASLSAPMSNAYQELLKISDAITVFDNDLAEEGASGTKIKTLLPKTAHDPGAENIINRVISDSNEQARGYIITSTQELVVIGKTLKQLIEDYVKQKPVLVQNWRELERYMEHPMKEFCVNIYKKIYLFVQLMQQYLSE